MKPLLEARNVDKVYGLHPVLRGVSLKLDRGEGAIIVGHNGSGKSTLIRILAGLSSVSAGEVLLFGQAARKLQPQYRRRLGLITHQNFLYPRLTARENLEFYGELYGLGHVAIRIGEMLEQVGLASVADEPVSTFSRGMEQRLTLARAIIAAPDVLLVDEPFAGLDGDGVDVAIGLIRDARQRGCTIVITMHEHLRFSRLAFHSYALVNGRLNPIGDNSKAEEPTERSAAAG
ncbi:MAG: heme ABC exporter ATP-binding protein CcmA [Deltaproteobacteria bacterium]|nr:heme ABC exporter ATP-binding protein CcmA [Deltaproteobacteria bacterium]